MIAILLTSCLITNTLAFDVNHELTRGTYIGQPTYITDKIPDYDEDNDVDAIEQPRDPGEEVIIDGWQQDAAYDLIDDIRGMMPQEVYTRVGIYGAFKDSFSYGRVYLVHALAGRFVSLDIGVTDAEFTCILAPMYNFYKKSIQEYKGIVILLDFGVGPMIKIMDGSLDYGIMFTFGTIKY